MAPAGTSAARKSASPDPLLAHLSLLGQFVAVTCWRLITEGTVAVIIVALLCILAAILWGSPNGGLTYPGGPKSPAGQRIRAQSLGTPASQPRLAGGDEVTH
jgi:hypothetical protein